MDKDALIRLYVRVIEYWLFLAPVVLIVFLIKKAITLKEKKYFLASLVPAALYLYCYFKGSSLEPEFILGFMAVSFIVIPLFFLWYGKKTRNYFLLALMTLLLLGGSFYLWHFLRVAL